MSEPADNSNAETSTPKAPKDKKCPYCGQSFTSSSLGRHLDLYIRERNPKAPDGVHDVEAIRKMRECITRRQPKGSASMSRRRTSTTPASTPMTRKSPTSEADSSSVRSPLVQKDTQTPAEATPNLYPFSAGWEATGVINEIPPKGEEPPAAPPAPASLEPARRPLPPRAGANRQQAGKAQLEMRQRVQDALDTARASELALRELISSWRAAKQHIDMNSMPFDFDPLSMDFPALTLQCLQPPPTLFSSTQHPTQTSWSVTPPGRGQYEALEAYFREEFRKFLLNCAAATTAVNEDIPYPPTAASHRADVREAVRRAERMAQTLERQVAEHLQSTFNMWESLPAPRRAELWNLELARSVGRKQKELDKLKDREHLLKQENANLKTQVEHLNRLQQPREFKLFPPMTYPVNEPLQRYLHEEALRGRHLVGLNLEDRHSDLNSVVSSAVDRWKSVIVAARAANGMNAQRSLEQAGSAPGSASASAPAATPTRGTFSGNASAAAAAAAAAAVASRQGSPLAPQQQLHQPSAPTPPAAVQPPQPAPQARQVSTATSTGPTGGTSGATTAAEARHSTAPTPIAPSADDEMSDEDADADADAEMEDEQSPSYAGQMNAAAVVTPNPPAPLARVPQQQGLQLQVPRTRLPGQPQPNRALAAAAATKNFKYRGGPDENRSATHTGQPRAATNQISMSRSMPNINSAMHAQSGQGSGQHHRASTHAEMGLAAMQGMGGTGEPMYMD